MKKKIILTGLLLFILLSCFGICGCNDTQNVSNQNATDQVTVYITPHGKKYHLKDCRTIKNTSTAISLKEAKEKGYTPCKVCSPPD